MFPLLCWFANSNKVTFKQIKISFPNNKTESEGPRESMWDKLDKDIEEITGDTGKRWRMANINCSPNVFVFPSCITRTKEVFVEWRHHHHNHGESNHMWKCFYELPIFFHQKAIISFCMFWKHHWGYSQNIPWNLHLKHLVNLCFTLEISALIYLPVLSRWNWLQCFN